MRGDEKSYFLCGFQYLLLCVLYESKLGFNSITYNQVFTETDLLYYLSYVLVILIKLICCTYMYLGVLTWPGEQRAGGDYLIYSTVYH